MGKMIKKTISTFLGKENYIIALMEKLGFREEERKAILTPDGDEKLILTFDGYEGDYHENDYVKVKGPTNGYFYYYSLAVPYGMYTNNDDSFKEMHDKLKTTNFVIGTFK